MAKIIVECNDDSALDTAKEIKGIKAVTRVRMNYDSNKKHILKR